MELFLNEFESFVGVNFWTMLFAWCNLLILYLFLRKILFGPIKKMIDDRQSEIDGMYEGAEATEREASELRASYERRLAEAESESEAMLRSATRRAELKSEEIIKEANAEASRILERAEETVELERRRIINEAKDEISEMAISIAGAVIERDVSAAEHERLIDDFIAGIGESDD